MAKIKAILQKIIGRIKKDMGAYYLTFGAIFLPLGFIVLLEYDDKLIAGLAFLMGMLSMLFGVLTIRKDKKENDRVLFNRWLYQTSLLQGMLEEIKRLRDEENGNDNSKPD